MQDRLYRQLDIANAQYLTIEASDGNVVFTVSDRNDQIISEFQAFAGDGVYIAQILENRFNRHQGYKNYETFIICHTLDNDQDLQAESAEVAQQAAEGEEYPDIAAAKALREWIEENHLTEDPEADAEDLLSDFAGPLLNAALGEVDWLEVARTCLQFAKEMNES